MSRVRLPGKLLSITSMMRPGPRAHDHDAARQEDRLGDGMGDEDDRLARLLPEPDQMLVQMVAGDLVEGAEGLVHQQELRLEAEGARDGDPLLHAAGELPGELPLEARQPHHLEISGGPRLALARAAAS